MSDDREIPAEGASGAPVEETEASRTEVLQAVERAREAAAAKGAAEERDEAAGEAAAVPGAGGADREADPASATGAEADAAAAEQARREQISKVDTELDLEPATRVERVAVIEELPSAGATAVLDESPARDGEIRISPDHPMAALYMQTPVPPDIQGNRGAGSLIALLATVGFAAVYAGVLSLWLAPELAPSQFVDGLLSYALSWGFIAAVAAFFIGLVVIVLIVGRAGWWAYVLGGFLVGALVWAAATAGYAASADGVRALFERSPVSLVSKFGLTVPAIAAGLVAREATIWFGAWIGSRGRRVKARNAAALEEYEASLAEVQAKQP